MDYFYRELYLLPFSHDETVHGKKTILDKLYGTYEEKFAQCRALYTYMFTHPGKKLNFMGNELGHFREWDESRELDWELLRYPAHDSFFHFFRELATLYLTSRLSMKESMTAPVSAGCPPILRSRRRAASTLTGARQAARRWWWC